MITRSATYWGKFRRSADLRAVEIATGRVVYRSGRGTHLTEKGWQAVEAGVWRDVALRAFRSTAWIPLADVPYIRPAEAIRGRRRSG